MEINKPHIKNHHLFVTHAHVLFHVSYDYSFDILGAVVSFMSTIIRPDVPHPVVGV